MDGISLSLIIISAVIISSVCTFLAVFFLLNKHLKKSFETELEIISEKLDAARSEIIKLEKESEAEDQEKSNLTKKNLELSNKNSALEEKVSRISKLEDIISEKDGEIKRLNDKKSKIESDFSALNTKLKEQSRQNKEKLAMVQDAEKKLGETFKNLANDIFESRSKKFEEENSKTLKTVLIPLDKNLNNFRKKIEELYVKEGQMRFSLAERIEKLLEETNKISKDANNLTEALKGSGKLQGDWGEIVLKRLLESSGLREGEEFTAQESVKTENDKNLRPDIVIYLPENRIMIIDSKVSLTAFERFCSSADSKIQQKAVKEHLNSVKKHIKELSEKNYKSLYGNRNISFVFMFIPIENALNLALKEDRNIIRYAAENNISLCTPTTLIAILKTVETLWSNEKQDKNAEEVLKRAGKLYDKFVLFMEEFLRIKEKLDQAEKAYDMSEKRLSSGKGSIIKNIDDLKNHGAKIKKNMSGKILDLADENKIIDV